MRKLERMSLGFLRRRPLVARTGSDLAVRGCDGTRCRRRIKGGCAEVVATRDEWPSASVARVRSPHASEASRDLHRTRDGAAVSCSAWLRSCFDYVLGAPVRYWPAMRVELAGRSFVRFVSMTGTDIDIGRISNVSDGARPTSQVLLPDLAVIEYPEFQVQLLPNETIQVQFSPTASASLVQQVASEIDSQSAPHIKRATGLNGLAKLTVDEAGAPPWQELVRGDVIEERLHVELANAGVRLQFADEAAVMTLNVMPDPADAQAWDVSLNRHYADPLGDEEKARAVEWLAQVDEIMTGLLDRLLAEA